MANGSLSALGPGGPLDLRDEGHTQGSRVVNSQGAILPHPHRDAEIRRKSRANPSDLKATWTQ